MDRDIIEISASYLWRHINYLNRKCPIFYQYQIDFNSSLDNHFIFQVMFIKILKVIVIGTDIMGHGTDIMKHPVYQTIKTLLTSPSYIYMYMY